MALVDLEQRDFQIVIQSQYPTQICSADLKATLPDPTQICSADLEAWLPDLFQQHLEMLVLIMCALWLVIRALKCESRANTSGK